MKKKLLYLGTIFLIVNGCGRIKPDLHDIKNENLNTDSRSNHNIYDGHTIYSENQNENSSKNSSILENTVTIDENPYGNRDTTDDSNSNANRGKSIKTYNSSIQGFRSIYFKFGEYLISSDMQDTETLKIYSVSL